ncbi:PIN/TRAM domain-containing protein [Facklamia sp. P12945]|uniref:PIN/TRAM domain-containing protein n=1 Tax=unclassified Facklamia TaxID=2622293 RepID=UPI003D177D98
MIKKMTISVSMIVGLSFGYTLGAEIWRSLRLYHQLLINPFVNSMIFGLIFMLLGILLAPLFEQLIHKLLSILEKQSTPNLLFGALGILLGLLIGYLLSLPIGSLDIPFLSSTMPLVLTVLGGMIGYQMMINRRDEVLHLFTKSGQKLQSASFELNKKPKQSEVKAGQRLKILDTSVIIDGRIAEVVQTGFIEGSLLVPKFVLSELQHIADASDSLKRAKGRRGLDILNLLQKSSKINIDFFEGDYADIEEVDAKLVRLAKDLNAILVTNDYNLNKVSEFQNVPVLNINELANAVKPEVLPGEEMQVQIIKAGTERRQGVAYLDDGTMVVVEDGQNYINKHLNVVVTSSLQTAAGRMIFAKIFEN